MNLGMNTMVLDINSGAWKLETERGVIMDGDKPEHILEAIPVMASYCDVIGVRAFAGLEDKAYDYQETIINQFIQYSGKPVFSMEAATGHPLRKRLVRKWYFHGHRIPKHCHKLFQILLPIL